MCCCFRRKKKKKTAKKGYSAEIKTVECKTAKFPEDDKLGDQQQKCSDRIKETKDDHGPDKKTCEKKPSVDGPPQSQDGQKSKSKTGEENKNADVFGKDKAPPGLEIKAPEVKGKVAAKDPQYMTMAALGNVDIFAKGKPVVGEIKAPEIKGQVDAKDPKYKTLAGMDNDEIFGGGAPSSSKRKFKPPADNQRVDDKDPQYKTLAGLNQDIFVDKGQSERKQSQKEKMKFKPPADDQRADGKDPKYMTLAGLNQDIFIDKDQQANEKKADEKKEKVEKQSGKEEDK